LRIKRRSRKVTLPLEDELVHWMQFFKDGVALSIFPAEHPCGGDWNTAEESCYNGESKMGFLWQEKSEKLLQELG